MRVSFFLKLSYFFLIVMISYPLKAVDFEYPKENVLRLAVIGLVHDHVNWILNRKQSDVKIVGIVETNLRSVNRYKKRYNIPDSLFFDSYESLLQNVEIDAVSAFNSTKEHLDVVKYFAPKGIPIMVEKPMATNYNEAKEMAEIVKNYKTPLLVNYETSWYETTYEAKTLLNQGSFGSLTKIVFNTGHPGPREIGCTPEFLSWLTDPILNGAGALTDFGCYGANITTWLLNGETPISISCVAKQTKPELYPKVDDDTTILLEYTNQQVIIQASWNWSHNRKDMQLYGTKGFIDCQNSDQMEFMENENIGGQKYIPSPIPKNKKDPFRLLYEVVFNDKKLEPFSLYSVENNLIVSKILSLALKASVTKKTQFWE